MNNNKFDKSLLSIGVASALLLGSVSFTHAQEETSEEEVESIEIKGSLGSLPGQDVESVFGFGKSILETPRSASTISEEQMARFNVSDIDELVAFAPGTFTQSFFGVAGSLDVRGNPGETYFRGVKRLDNPGNYPTPIGASSRIDIVRGPASPIYGPSKVGGYLNFIPKSARASGGQYLESNTGAMSYTTGSWDKSILTAELGGPATIAGKKFGFYVYGELENSGSYYDNTSTDQTILQAAFDLEVNDSLRLEFGGMYHNYDGNQVAGWNRLTQELIDNGTYVTGTAQPLDTDGDGSISHQEYNATADFTSADVDGDGAFGINPFVVFASIATVDDLDSLMTLENVGSTTLKGNQVLVAPDDTLENEVTTLYFDAIYFTDSGWEIKNQLFYEAYENLNENAYGFSQFHDTWVIEDKLIFANEFETNSMVAQVQISPSIRFTDFLHGDDYTNEYFDRRDLTMASSALDRRVLSTRIDDDYSEYYEGDYLNLGLAFMTDLTWDFGLNLVLGLRYDQIDIDSKTDVDRLLFGNFTTGNVLLSDDGQFILNDFVDTSDFSEENINTPIQASDTFDGISWNASISYNTPVGLIPYITASEQSTLIAGQGAEVTTGNVYAGTAFDASELFEYGIKGSFLDDSLYMALSIYEQERTDFNAQAIVTNATTQTEGTEFELRWVVNDQLVVTAGYTNVKVYNLTAIAEGEQFGFFGYEDFVMAQNDSITDPSLLFGGNAIGVTLVNNKEDARKAGIPENIYSLTATYDFQNGVAASVSVIDADEAYSGFSKAVTLPAYTLVNAGISYQTDDWMVNLTVKNLTDEKYFRSNFPDLFGSQIVLPELPRHFNAKFTYNF